MTNPIEDTTFKPAFNKVIEEIKTNQEVKTNQVKLQKVTNHGFRMQAIGAPVAIGGALIAGTIAAIAVAILFAPIAAPLLAIIGTVGVASFGAVAAGVAILATLVAVGLLIGGHFVKKNEQAQADKITKQAEEKKAAEEAAAKAAEEAAAKAAEENDKVLKAVELFDAISKVETAMSENTDLNQTDNLEVILGVTLSNFNMFVGNCSVGLQDKIMNAIKEKTQSV